MKGLKSLRGRRYIFIIYLILTYFNNISLISLSPLNLNKIFKYNSNLYLIII